MASPTHHSKNDGAKENFVMLRSRLTPIAFNTLPPTKHLAWVQFIFQGAGATREGIVMLRSRLTPIAYHSFPPTKHLGWGILIRGGARAACHRHP